MALLRAGAEVVGYELREDFADRAAANVAAWSGDGRPLPGGAARRLSGHRRAGLDRVVLDLPEPWRVLDHADAAMRPGGILCAYLPTINQTVTIAPALERGAFGMAATLEVLHRTWHIEAALGPARPPHGRPHRVPDHRPPARPWGRSRRPAGHRPVSRRPVDPEGGVSPAR